MWGSWNLFLFFFIFVCCCCCGYFFFLFLFILVFIISAFLYGSGCSYCCGSGLLFTKDIKSEGKWASVAWKWRDYVKWRGSAGVDVDNLIIDDDVEVAHLLLSIPYIFFCYFYCDSTVFFDDSLKLELIRCFLSKADRMNSKWDQQRIARHRWDSSQIFNSPVTKCKESLKNPSRIPQESLKDPRSLSIMKIRGHRGPNPLIGTSMID